MQPFWTKKMTILTILSATLMVLLKVPTGTIYAEQISEIRSKIETHNDRIREIEEEIRSYEKQVEAVGTEARSLESAIKILDINQKKITAEIRKTEANIQKTNLTISNLGKEIGEIELKILSNIEAIEKTLNDMRQNDEESLIESFLTNKSISQVFDEYESVSQFQEKVINQSRELALYKNELGDKKNTTEKEKKKLSLLKGELGDQNKILNNNKKEKNNLLATTKNKETEYKRILTNKQREKERFEQELFEFENQLKRAIDPNSFPSGKKGILYWPLDNILITQAFGKTVDAKRLYASGTHNGVDFRASRGTPVKAVLSGIVEGSGNTDEERGCYSYGKWILIRHDNGLSSLYAHLDLSKVSKGQRVEDREIIGYSGESGYATGPHLHFTLYASQGVLIQRYSSSLHCKNTSIPIADRSAYLDPLLYF